MTAGVVSWSVRREGELGPDGIRHSTTASSTGAMGSEEPDEGLYRSGRLSGGLAYTDDELRGIFSWLRQVELRRMRDHPPDADVFGVPFLWVALFRRPGRPAMKRAADRRRQS
jgi:hypothetical protein